MNVKKLKKLLETVDDNCLVVVSVFDHSYREASAYEETAGLSEDFSHLSEWAGPKHASPGEKPIPVLVIE